MSELGTELGRASLLGLMAGEAESGWFFLWSVDQQALPFSNSLGLWHGVDQSSFLILADVGKMGPLL